MLECMPIASVRHFLTHKVCVNFLYAYGMSMGFLYAYRPAPDAHTPYGSTVDYMHKRIIHLLNILKLLNCTPKAVNRAQPCCNYTLHNNSYGLVPNQF